MFKKYKDVVIGSVLAVLSCIYLFLSFQIKLTNIDRVVGSRLFPQICGTVILVLSVYLMGDGLHRARGFGEPQKEERKCYKKTILVLGSYAAYIFMMDKIGFTCSSVIYLFSQMVVMGKRPVSRKTLILYLAISAASSAAIYILFNRVFMLILPKAGWL